LKVVPVLLVGLLGPEVIITINNSSHKHYVFNGYILIFRNAKLRLDSPDSPSTWGQSKLT